MRVPVSWLREYADVPSDVPVTELAQRLTDAGLKMEAVERVGADLRGPLVAGQVRDVEQFVANNGKTIRWCQVDVGESAPRGIVCGATNFSVDDLVVVALPGAVLPGGFEISARRTYGHVSDGMICSAHELGLGTDHAGILVLGSDEHLGVLPGADLVDVLGLVDDVLDIEVTPDRGYCLSVRGVAREAATAFAVAFRDPAEQDSTAGDMPLPDGVGEGHPVGIDDPTAGDRIVLRTVTGVDPGRGTPLWMQRRLLLAGMRPISLAVDVTNYVMVELGQPLHAFDRGKLRGTIGVRRARAGERLETLDHVVRDLHPEDILITDETGPLSLAGTMGGLDSEIDESSTDLVIEAAHFSATGTARMSRRHNLSSEASRRFERGVDSQLPPLAAARAVALLTRLAGARYVGSSEVDLTSPPAAVVMSSDLPSRVAGRTYDRDTVARRLTDIGATVAGDGQLLVTPPSWRPDLTDPADLVEEVLRLEGYATLPSALPLAPAGRGLTREQLLRRRVSRALGAAGYVEVLNQPFVGTPALDALGIAEDDVRRTGVALVNPLSEEEPQLRTTLLPGLLRTLARNIGKGFPDVALAETGLVFRPRQGAPERAAVPAVDRRPTDEQLVAVEAALPNQPAYLAVALAGQREPAGWWGEARPATWADAVQAAREVAAAVRVPLRVRAGQLAPWHPGRCAELMLASGAVVGYAGELHPRVTAALGLPARSCAMELDLSPLLAAAPDVVGAPEVSPYPVATADVSLSVDAGTPAADVEQALRDGAGALLESVRLFDVYAGAQAGEGRTSLAYALRFRAPDRTLTTAEVAAARDDAVAEAARRTGAVPRGG
jgi:phenylalanyl-tRNA synthetase beta chain